MVGYFFDSHFHHKTTWDRSRGCHWFVRHAYHAHRHTWSFIPKVVKRILQKANIPPAHRVEIGTIAKRIYECCVWLIWRTEFYYIIASRGQYHAMDYILVYRCNTAMARGLICSNYLICVYVCVFFLLLCSGVHHRVLCWC